MRRQAVCWLRFYELKVLRLCLEHFLLVLSAGWTLMALNVSTSVSALLFERFVALVSPIFYARRLGIGFSILTLLVGLVFVATLGAIILAIEPPLEAPPACLELGCLLHPTSSALLLLAKISTGSINLLLAIAVCVAIRRYSKAQPAYFRRVSKFISNILC